METKRLGLLIFLIATALIQVNAQTQNWRNFHGKTLMKFDWSCATPAAYPSVKLTRVVNRAMKQNELGGFGSWSDRAFAFDLNGDHKLEFFVPLDCGGTGNCTWGLFALKPARQLGIIVGQYLYVHRVAGHWPDLITYSHLSAVEGSLMTYRFSRRSYRSFGPRYPINQSNFDSEIQPGVTNKMPAFLHAAKVGCDSAGS
ncbi:MAG TPA: hypothetical protein VIX17_11310 [Pyrinomonadaceae bacterium]